MNNISTLDITPFVTGTYAISFRLNVGGGRHKIVQYMLLAGAKTLIMTYLPDRMGNLDKL